jgi:hypothetical protein
MGARDSKLANELECSDLAPGSDGCDIGKCVARVKGQFSKSASPSDMWILTFRKGTTSQGRIIRSGFMKWWISPNSRETTPTLALSYEMNVYDKIIGPLSVHHVSPNFVNYLASGSECSFEKLEEMLRNRTDYLIRNIGYMANFSPGRPSVTKRGHDHFETEDNTEVDYNIAYDWTYDFLILETFSKTSMSLLDWVLNVYKTRKGKLLSGSFWNIIFQVTAALYTLSLAKLGHNDLHWENIWIDVLPTVETTVYVLDNVVYTLKSKYRVMIYDFDASYVKRLGINSNVSSADNTFFPNKEAVKFIKSIHINLPTDKKLSAKQSHDIQNIVLTKHIGTDKRNQTKWSSIGRPINEIVARVAKYAMLDKHSGDIPRTDWYICNPSMFKSNGVLRI